MEKGWRNDGKECKKVRIGSEKDGKRMGWEKLAYWFLGTK